MDVDRWLTDVIGLRDHEDGSTTLDASMIAKLASQMDVDVHELTATARFLISVHGNETVAFEMRTGVWRIDLLPAVARSVVLGAVTATILPLLGIDSVPTAVLSIVAPILLAIDRVEVDAPDLVIYAQLVHAGAGTLGIEELYDSLPHHVRGELSVGEFAGVVERLHRAGLAQWRADGVTLISPGRRRGFKLVFRGPAVAEVARQLEIASRGSKAVNVELARKVFVIHGRDTEVRDSMFNFLRALYLEPLEWESLVNATGSTAPFLGDVVTRGLSPGNAQAVVALLTPDDIVRLHPNLHDARGEPDYETKPAMQPRPNVLIELGLALGAFHGRTIIVEFGNLRPIADLVGRNTIRFDGSDISLGKIVERLKAAECAVNDKGADWRRTDSFAKLDAYYRKPATAAK